MSLDFKKAIVINGHGAQTSKKFTVNKNILVTPDNLENPYIFSLPKDYAMEEKLREGKLKPLTNGKWSIYDEPSKQIPDILIKPWSSDEIVKFANSLLSNNKMWSFIDKKEGIYCDRDPNSKMVLKKPDGSMVVLDNVEAKKYIEKVKNKQVDSKNGVPLFFYAPAVGKVKILGHTSLSEVIQQINKIDGDKIILCATCNAVPHTKVVSLETTQPDVDLSKMFSIKEPALPASIPLVFSVKEETLPEVALSEPTIEAIIKIALLNRNPSLEWKKIIELKDTWEIGKAKFNGNMAIATRGNINPGYHIELDNGYLVCKKKPGWGIVSTPNFETLIDSETRDMLYAMALRSTLDNYMLFHETNGKWSKIDPSDWEVGKKDNKISIANSQYHIEFAQKNGTVEVAYFSKSKTKPITLTKISRPQVDPFPKEVKNSLFQNYSHPKPVKINPMMGSNS